MLVVVAERGRPKQVLVLSDEERAMLSGWARRRTSAQALAQRARIVLACAQEGGLRSNTDVAAQERVSLPTVGKWRKRFLERRLDGLSDESRPGGPRTITDEQVEQVLVATLERSPRNATHWSRASMAAETGLSKSSVGRIWKAFEVAAAPDRRVQDLQ